MGNSATDTDIYSVLLIAEPGTLLREGAAAEGHVTAHPAGDFVHAVMAEVTRMVSGSTIRRMCNSRGPEPFDKRME